MTPRGPLVKIFSILMAWQLWKKGNNGTCFFFFACRLALEGFESGSEGLTKEELKGKEVFEKLREEHQRLARVAIHTLMPAKIFQLNALLKVQLASFSHIHIHLVPCREGVFDRCTKEL